MYFLILFQVDLDLSVNDGKSMENIYQDTNQYEDQQDMTFVLLNEVYSHLFLSGHSSNSEILSNIIENIPVNEDNQAVETEDVSELEVDFENDYNSDNGTILSQDEENHQDIYYLLNFNGDNNLEEIDFD